LALLCLISIAHAAEAQKQGKILLSRDRINLPPYSEIAERPLIHLYAPEPAYVEARADTRFVLERLTYASDGIEVVAHLYRSSTEGAARPTIVFNRGSYIRQDTAPEHITSFHRLALAGYTVLAPMYRGSEGAEGQDQMGGDDLNDLMKVAELAKELASVDSDQLFLYGESRGGMMVLQAIRDDFPARAAATFGAFTNLYRLMEDSPEQYEPLANQLWPEWRENPEAIIGRRSAVTWAEQIDTPLLIMHGGNDQSMPVEQSLELAGQLQRLGKIYELVIYGYDNHRLSRNAEARDARAMAWFKRHSEE